MLILGFDEFALFTRIEETWRLWQKFNDDYQHFMAWLQETERVAKFPMTAQTHFVVLKGELKKFEVQKKRIAYTLIYDDRDILLNVLIFWKCIGS